MNSFSIFFVILFFTASAALGQKQDEAALATAKGRTFTVQSLSPAGQKIFAEQKAEIANIRSQLFSQMISELLLDLESKAASSTPDKLLAAEKAKVPAPAAAQIQAVYDANRAALGDKPLDDVKPQIVAFLRREPEQAVIDAYLKSLQTKYKAAFGRNINAADLKPFDMIATIGSKMISAQEFETKYHIAINDELHHQYEDIRGDLEASILSALIDSEAKAQNTDVSSIIAAEITNKLREFSDEERAALETALMKRLSAKYEVSILLKEPATIAQNISVDDDPSRGRPAAPVTVVMFSDFQCSACSRAHPVLKKVIDEFGDKVRFVVRDYPLVNIHENAFLAATAANAANKQGKFFEFSEVLYGNQDALDRESLKKYAAGLGLNVKQFELDLSDEKSAAEIRKDIADGATYGVSSTPTIFVNGVKVHRLSAESFRHAIERAMPK